MKIGQRVGAIQCANEETVYLYGFGRYVGYQVPPHNNENNEPALPNPKIELDDGTVLWGRDCWWGSEEEVIELIGNRQVEIVNLMDESNSTENLKAGVDK